MSRPRVVLLRGHNANPWDLRPWELLVDRWDVRVLVTDSNRFALEDLRLPVERVRTRRDALPRGRAGDLGVLAVGDRYRDLDRHLEGAAIVHSAELGVPWSAQPVRAKGRLRFKLVLTVWETIPFRNTYRAARGRAYRAETIPAVDLFLAASERAGEGLRLEGVSSERIQVCYPGVDIDRFGAGGLAREPDLVVSPGRVVWEKGHQDVIRALALARLDRRLLVVGAGPEERRLRAYADELGVRLEIRSVPYAGMPEIFARAGCVVLASLATPHWEEQFGMVLAEAMAAGAPVVASASGAIPEVVGDGGALFRPGDWPSLAGALTDPPPPADPAWVRDRYSLAVAAERIERAYGRVLAD
jgi:glycosyltransferase involved in cell wall biosynthesis